MTEGRKALLIRVLWSAGFLVGTTTHTIDLILGGVEVYSAFPLPVRLFWVSLTLFDPLVVVLLWTKPRAAVVIGLIVMVLDVSVNAAVFVLSGSLSPFGIASQILFGCFVAATAPILWRRLKRIHQDY